ncbi:uncharacterized protein LOC112345522 isoform X2 [Selaginella moellendorffii]|uniref:uncharacterized protein LOC112345522 isoform X2 n=1 Tax=Selaginella moellendorffii TaxID=88036 RepID=UPI000D1D0D7A|nr:uncharacterized protein LOC112345522 isoform X2 [Selaginella moellendorffii]|eukprot:XP_024528194.1 uncharacterized protein LOC112345522 isoform X2 [Selaginella moellendorffii]
MGISVKSLFSMVSPASAFCGSERAGLPACKFYSGRRKIHRCHCVFATMDVFSSDDIVLESLLGTYGYMSISSYDPPKLDGGIESMTTSLNAKRFGGQEVDAGNVETRLYSGRVRRGPNTGTRILLKAYPVRNAGGHEADMMAANELSSHAILQDSSMGKTCENIIVLLGGFETRTGEQWLVFRNDGIKSGADYAMAAGVATQKGISVGVWDFWDRFEKAEVLQRRHAFIRKLLAGAFTGLSFMHARGQLHQSLGPASVILNTMEERNISMVLPRLRDLAFAVDVSNETLFRGADPKFGALSDNLWRRAAAAGARTIFERKAFGIADDIFSGGLLLAYIVFASLSVPGSVDAPSLQRLLESTFRLDLTATREYCMMDDRWEEAVKFLDLDNKAGWELLQAMLNPDYRQRPIADAVLCHRFMTG